MEEEIAILDTYQQQAIEMMISCTFSILSFSPRAFRLYSLNNAASAAPASTLALSSLYTHSIVMPLPLF